MVAVGLRRIQLIVFCLMTTIACFAGELPISQEPEVVPEVPTVPVPEQNVPAPQEPTPQPNFASSVAREAAKGVPASEVTKQQPASVVPTQAVPVQLSPSLDSLKNSSEGSRPAESLEEQLKRPVVNPAATPVKAAAPVAVPEVKKQEPAQAAPKKAASVQPAGAVPVNTVVPVQPVGAAPAQAVLRNSAAKQPAESAAQHAPEESPSEIAIEEEELVGIDTVDLEEPQGNWLFKRLWWERAEEKYEEIRALEAQVLELRMPFFMKRTDVDRSVLDPFYLHIAKDRGALEILLSDIGEFLAQEEAREGVLDEAERGMRDQLEAERETLVAMQKNIQAILNFDRELDAAIGTLMEQLNRVSEYEREAWHYFKEIGRVLNDKKAREYVLKMKNIHRNIKEIQEYIQERFAMYFDQLISTIKEDADQVTSAMDRLREKGIDLKEQLGHIKEQDKVTEVEEIEESPRPKVDDRGFFERYIISPLGSFFGAIWNGIVAVVQWPYNLIFGSKKPAPLEEVEYEEVAVEPPSTESED